MAWPAFNVDAILVELRLEAGRVMQCLFITLGSVLIMVIGNPWISLLVLPMVLTLKFIFSRSIDPCHHYYNQMNSSKTPILNHFSEALYGIFSIRCYDLADTLTMSFRRSTLTASVNFFNYHSCMRWMHFNSDSVCAIFIIVNIFASLIMIDFLDRKLVSTGLSLILVLAMDLVWTMFQFSQVQTYMASAERMLHRDHCTEHRPAWIHHAGAGAGRVDADADRASIFASLGTVRYLSLMKTAAVVVGNSSSGIVEAPALGVPTVNIGSRQGGRTRAGSVLDVVPERAAIRSAIEKALSSDLAGLARRVSNPYGDGTAAPRIKAILDALLEVGLPSSKLFYDACADDRQ